MPVSFSLIGKPSAEHLVQPDEAILAPLVFQLREDLIEGLRGIVGVIQKMQDQDGPGFLFWEKIRHSAIIKHLI